MDRNYWEIYYAKQNSELKPSLFAKYIAGLVGTDKKSVVELGCGNGRDAVFFANEGMEVLAVDQVESEIKFLKNRYKQLQNLRFKCADFTEFKTEERFDIVYSRFTLHSISAEQEERVLRWAHGVLNANGLVCIEVRGQKNEIYKIGTPVEGEIDAFILDDHYRRFINFEFLCGELVKIGFKLVFAAEEKGFAPFNGGNETYIRVVAEKI